MKSATHNRFGAAGWNRRCTRSAGRAAAAGRVVDDPLAAAGAGQPQLAHQPLDCAPRDRDALAAEREPDLARSVDAVVLLMHPSDRDLQPLLAQARRDGARLAAAS